MFVAVIYSHVSNLHSTESRFIRCTYKAYQNVGNLMDFRILLRRKSAHFKDFYVYGPVQQIKWKKSQVVPS